MKPSDAVKFAAQSRHLPVGLTNARHETVSVNGVKLHYVVDGDGDPVVLVPGWPESWYAWRQVMPELVRNGRRVFAIDPRGFGDSEKPLSGYDPDTTANDLHAFIEALGLASGGGVDIVGHDVGTWIAFNHATRFPNDVRRLVLTDAAIPGVSSPPGGVPDRAKNIKTWHFAFNRLDELPEILVKDRERTFLIWLFANKTLRKGTFDEAAIDEYVRVLSSPGATRSGFEYFRAAFDDGAISQAKIKSARLTMPVLALGGEGGVSDALLKTMQTLGDDVHGGVIAGCGHYLPEERPEELARAILDFWQSNPSNSQSETEAK
jgi:pimeloyl-ACP methyl ester carboxylesterase